MGRKDNIVQNNETPHVGARMRLARQSQAMSLKEMSIQVNYTVPYLSAIENGKGRPSYALVEMYEQKLGLEAGALSHFMEEAETLLPPASSHKEAPSSTPSDTPADERQGKADWGEVPDISDFYGRTKELEILSTQAEKSRIIAIIGLGGVGKTSLAAALAHRIKHQFDYVFWRSLENMPALEHVLKRCIGFVSQYTQTDLPDNEDELISLLIEYLRKHRCLLVLDNFESVLQASQRAGQYREDHKGYGKLLKRLGESEHQSCLALTSREKPREIVYLEGPSAFAHVLSLSGVGGKEAREILKEKGLSGTEEEWSSLNKLYAGNPLSLKLVSTTIREMFEGHISSFLSHGATVFGDVYDLLRQQIERLSQPEQEILYWLSIEQVAISLHDLRRNMMRRVSGNVLLEALDSLKRRSLITTAEAGRFSLHSVVKEYVTNDFVERIAQEFIEESVEIFDQDTFFDHYPLMRAQAKDHVRSAQKRLILDPLAERLRTTLGQVRSEKKLKNITDRLRKTHRAYAYAAGNALNLLIHLRADLRGSDFSQLGMREAYLRGVELPEVNFSQADLSTAVFTETFGSILSIAIDVHGQLLAAGTVTGEIRTWHLSNQTPVLTLWGHTNWVWSVAFSPDGSLLASGSDDRTVRLWEVSTGQCLNTLAKHTDRVRSVVFSPDGQVLVSGCEDGIVRLWNVETGELEDELDVQGGHIYALAFSPDGQLLACACEDGTVRLWNAETREIESVLEKQGGHVYALAFSSDGQQLASGREDGSVQLWDINTRTCTTILYGEDGQVYTLAFRPDGQWLVSGCENGAVVLWDIPTHQRHNALREHSNRVYSVVFSPDGQVLASGSSDQTVKLWDTSTEQCLDTLQGYTNLVWSVVFSSDGHMLASGSNDQKIRLWDVEKEQCLRILEGHDDRVRAVAFRPDGRLLASGAEDKTARLWDVMTGQCLRTLEGHSGRVRTVAFRPDGRLLATGGEEGLVIVWKVSTGQRVATLDGYGGQVYAVEFSPDGQTLASGSEDGSVRLWDIHEDHPWATLRGHQDRIYALAFSPDGQLLASGSNDQTVKLWDAETGKHLDTLIGHSNRIYSLAFSLDGQLLASGSNDQTVKLWETSTRQCKATLKGDDIWVYSIAFHPQGHILASGSNKGTIELWDVSMGENQHSRPLKIERPYEGMDITRATGLTGSRYTMLLALGAVDKAPSMDN